MGSYCWIPSDDKNYDTYYRSKTRVFCCFRVIHHHSTPELDSHQNWIWNTRSAPRTESQQVIDATDNRYKRTPLASLFPNDRDKEMLAEGAEVKEAYLSGDVCDRVPLGFCKSAHLSDFDLLTASASYSREKRQIGVFSCASCMFLISR